MDKEKSRKIGDNCIVETTKKNLDFSWVLRV